MPRIFPKDKFRWKEISSDSNASTIDSVFLILWYKFILSPFSFSLGVNALKVMILHFFRCRKGKRLDSKDKTKLYFYNINLIDIP